MGGLGKRYSIEELVRIVAPLAEVHNITSVSLFGSRATGMDTAECDYDFLIETNRDFRFFDYFRFVDGLEAILGPVDIVFRNTLDDDGFSRAMRRDEIYTGQ